MKHVCQIGLIVLISLMGLIGSVRAQSPFSFDFHGFVNPHYYADSRAVVGGREDMMLFYPKPVVLDSLGHDVNDGWQANMLAITARLGLRVSGPDMLGAKTSAYIEGDFTGSTNATIDNLRLRHAYITMDWYENHGEFQSLKHTLKVGQYWYPMVIHEIMPMTNPLNMGAPFHCYARQPQVRYEYISHRFEVVAAACWQLDNMSQGLLDGMPVSSTQFARHSMVPELNAQLRYRTGRFFVGAAVNAKTIQPVVNTTGVAADGSLHTSLTYSVFGRLKLDGITFKAQTLLNNSLYEGCSMGGYTMMRMVGSDVFEVEDWHFNTVWFDVERNTGHWRPGIFLGYAQNKGGYITDASDLAPTVAFYHVFGRGKDIDYLWRVQPRLTYDTGKGLSFCGEAEYTRAGYAEPVGNMRMSLSVTYAF